MIDIKPDIRFKKEIKKVSGSSLNECIQCGTCSVVCSLAPEDRPFPRKEMMWAAWGLKDKLMANVDVWLCHQCGDCSTNCPRGVNPADVISSIRQLNYMYYARPRFFATMLSKPGWLAVAILIPVIIISIILLLAGSFYIPDGPVNYSEFFPHSWLNASFSTITIIVYGFAVAGLIKFWKDLKINLPDTKPKINFFKALFQVIGELLSHRKFGDCGSQKTRKIAHFLVFYGFIILFLMTLYAIYAVEIKSYPLDLTNPFKIAGNIGSLMLVVGLCLMIFNRMVYTKEYGNTNYSDWLLLISMLLLTISGLVVQFARFENWSLAYHYYFFHLVCVWFVIIYLPYTKFTHMIYRLLALTFSRMIGRK